MEKNLLLVRANKNPKHLYFGKSSQLRVPPLGLGVVAALTPDNWNVTIVDESVNPIKGELNGAWDAVGISTMTEFVNRAYELATHFKNKDIPVILGGSHPSLLPEEAMRFSDSVVVGEAENVWSQVIHDLENGALKNKYHEPTQTLAGYPSPKRDLFSDSYKLDALITSRGCPGSCDYCSIPRIYGKGVRQRELEDILDEWKSIEKKLVLVADDNLFGYSAVDTQRGINLARAKSEKGLPHLWICQTSLNMVECDEALQAMSESGGKLAFIGLESLSGEVLEDMGKGVNLRYANKVAKGNIEEAYIRAIDKFHKHGIAVAGSFVFGYDSDPDKIFSETGKFIAKSGLDIMPFFVAKPYPGTPFREKMKKEKRLLYNSLPADWDQICNQLVTYDLKKSESSLRNGLRECLSYVHALTTKSSKYNTETISGKPIAELCHGWNVDAYKQWAGKLGIVE